MSDIGHSLVLSKSQLPFFFFFLIFLFMGSNRLVIKISRQKKRNLLNLEITESLPFMG